MISLISLLAFLLVIGVCVIIHEGGHYFAAVWRDVKVHEFAFGMGPKLFSRRKNGTLWALRIFPIGGFVRLEGLEDEPLPDDVPDPTRAFNIRKAWERFVIIAGGAFMNILLAWILTVILLMFYGVLDIKPIVGKLMDGYPAASMGIMPGDRVISINGAKITEWQEIRENLQKLTKDDVEFVIERNGRTLKIEGKVPYNSEQKARLLGVQSVKPERIPLSPPKAVFSGLSYCWKMSVEILKGLWQMLTGTLKADVAGPVGIAVMAGEAARQGFWTFITFLAVINLNLGLLNLLPLPALDGGRLVFLLWEMITGHKFPEKWENRIHMAGFAMLMVLIAFVTWKDILRQLH